MSIMVSLMCRGVQQRARGRQRTAGKMVVGDISGPPLGTGLHVPTKQTMVVFMLSKMVQQFFETFKIDASHYNPSPAGVPEGVDFMSLVQMSLVLFNKMSLK